MRPSTTLRHTMFITTFETDEFSTQNTIAYQLNQLTSDGRRKTITADAPSNVAYI